jgi:hypothetical protein
MDLQRWFVLIIRFYVKPYFPVKEVCLDWQKLILQIQMLAAIGSKAHRSAHYPRISRYYVKWLFISSFTQRSCDIFINQLVKKKNYKELR